MWHITCSGLCMCVWYAILKCMLGVMSLHHMTRPVCILEGFRYTYVKVNPARVRIWVISTVTAPNKHISCKNCSSRTGSLVTATMIVVYDTKKVIAYGKISI